MSERATYTARARQLPLSADQLDFLNRRTWPFLDGVGLQTHSIQKLLQEAYLQGVADAVDVYTEKQTTPLTTPHTKS